MNTPIVVYNTFYHSWHEAMKRLSDERYGKLSKALNDYCFFGIVSDLQDEVLEMLFISYKSNIDASTRNKVNGKLGGKRGRGGAPKGNTNALKNNSPLLNNQYPPFEENNSNVNVNVKENVKKKNTH